YRCGEAAAAWRERAAIALGTAFDLIPCDMTRHGNRKHKYFNRLPIVNGYIIRWSAGGKAGLSPPPRREGRRDSSSGQKGAGVERGRQCRPMGRLFRLLGFPFGSP